MYILNQNLFVFEHGIVFWRHWSCLRFCLLRCVYSFRFPQTTCRLLLITSRIVAFNSFSEKSAILQLVNAKTQDTNLRKVQGTETIVQSNR